MLRLQHTGESEGFHLFLFPRQTMGGRRTNEKKAHTKSSCVYFYLDNKMGKHKSFLFNHQILCSFAKKFYYTRAL